MIRRPRWYVALLPFALAVTMGAACSPAVPPAPGGSELVLPERYGGQYAQGTATGDTEAGAAFARWVLEQDPNQQYITDAVVRGEQVLAIKVQPGIRKGELQQLLEALTLGMARTFPSTPVTVMAYYQSGDKLAESRYDPRTGDVDVRFA